MNKAIIAFWLIHSLAGCRASGNFTSQVSSGYRPPLGNEIAIAYLDYADVSIADTATSILEDHLRQCHIIGFLSAEQTATLLEENGLSLPRRLTTPYLQSLHEKIPTTYLLTGGISIWKMGQMGFFESTRTTVAISLTMYDLVTGKVVWSVSGVDEGPTGVEMDPRVKAGVVFSGMLREWKGFCR